MDPIAIGITLAIGFTTKAFIDTAVGAYRAHVARKNYIRALYRRRPLIVRPETTYGWDVSVQALESHSHTNWPTVSAGWREGDELADTVVRCG